MRQFRTQSQALDTTRLLALATTAGTICALVVYLFLARQTKGDGVQVARTAEIAVAAKNLPPRQLLAPSMVRFTSCPAPDCPAGALPVTTHWDGEVTAQEISIGEPLTQSNVSARSSVRGLSPEIANDMRAVSIALDPAGGSVGFLEPGDHVDVLATFNSPDQQSVARLVVPDARLLALGTAAEVDTSSRRPATSAMLEVSPRGAQALALASARGQLTIALRGLGDDEDAPLPPLQSAAITGLAPSTPLPPRTDTPRLAPLQVAPTPTPPTVEARPSPPVNPQIIVVRGTQKTTVTVGP